MGKVSGGDGKSHGGVNSRQELERDRWDWDVQGKRIGGVWGIFFTRNYCYFFGAPKKVSMDEELSQCCWCPAAILPVAAGSGAQVNQVLSSIS